MGGRAITIGLLAMVCGVLVVSTAPGGPATRVVAAVELRPDGGGNERGAAYFTQRGRRLQGWVVVWGLEPRTGHAVHFHGPNGTCKSNPAKPPMAAHADLVADARGVAFRRFSVLTPNQVLRRGFYYNVHARPAAAGSSPSVTCGEIRPLRVSG